VLRELLEAHNLALDSNQHLFLERHLDFVIETNDAIRLTAIVERGEAERLHILDSLLVLPEILAAPAGPMLDMGSGGGFPGIPLAVVSGRDTDLLDSVQKKARAVQSFLDTEQEKQPQLLFPRIRSLGMRAEELAIEYPSYYGVVTARALSSLPALVELATPLLCLGGQLVALKGRSDDKEIERGVKAANRVGMKFVTKRKYSLSGGNEQRTAIVLKRVKESSIGLPRRPGMAQRKPLA
jgi:16S rRNA (guanine527-N7)-methyltransferase